MNLKVAYYTPEEYFLGDRPAKFLMGAFNPRDYLPATRLDSEPETNEIKVVPAVLPSPEPDVIVFVGSPASGKSTFFRQHLEPMGYVRINQDTLKTRDRCVAEATTFLTDNKHIVIGSSSSPVAPPHTFGTDAFGDNTNPTKATRKIWVDLAKKFNRSIRCIYFTASPQLARHNNLVRTLGGYAKVITLFTRPANEQEDRKLLPMSAIYMFANRFQEPTLDEGFEQIIKIDFQFRGTPQEQEIWNMWWD